MPLPPFIAEGVEDEIGLGIERHVAAQIAREAIADARAPGGGLLDIAVEAELAGKILRARGDMDGIIVDQVDRTRAGNTGIGAQVEAAILGLGRRRAQQQRRPKRQDAK